MADGRAPLGRGRCCRAPRRRDLLTAAPLEGAALHVGGRPLGLGTALKLRQPAADELGSAGLIAGSDDRSNGRMEWI